MNLNLKDDKSIVNGTLYLLHTSRHWVEYMQSNLATAQLKSMSLNSLHFVIPV